MARAFPHPPQPPTRPPMDPNMTAIDLRGVTLRRNGKQILTDIGWRVPKGERWAILGANGSGKTTLLKVITGYEWPTAGAVTVLGQRFGQCSLPALRKRIGWVSSALEHKLPPQLTALEIALSGFDASIGVYREFGAAEQDAALARLSALGGGHCAHVPYGLLSQGEQQRTVIARALINNPGLLILDEPCAGLDPAAREAFLEDMGLLARSPDAPTLLFVTHHVEEISPWIANVLVLRDGYIHAQGPTDAVLTGPILGAAFGRACAVHAVDSRYTLRFHAIDGPGSPS